MGEISEFQALDTWTRRPDIFVRDVIGIGSGKCNCNPPCKMDPKLTQVLKDYGDLVYAKEMIHYADNLRKSLINIEPTKERYDKAIKQCEFYQGTTAQRGKDEYEYWFNESKKLYKKIEKHLKSFKRIEHVEKKFGWAREIIGISMMTAKGVGKTALMSWINMHFYILFDGSKGIVTAPKKDLLDDNLKSEMKKWIRHSQEVYGDDSLLSQMIEITSDKMFIKVKDKKQWGNTKFLAFRTANLSAPKDIQEQTLQGYHEEYMLLGVDEASGVSDVVFKPLITTLTGKVNIALMIFNPNKNTGFAYDSHFDDNKNRLWLRYHISAEESSLVSQDSIERAKIFFKDDENGYRVSVLGLPPLEEEGALIPYSKISESREREIPLSMLEKSPIICGFDVGGGGDLNAISVLQGNKCHRIYTLKSGDEHEIASWAVSIFENENPDKIGVDGVGIGFMMPALLRKCGIDCAIRVDSRHKSPDPKYGNMRAYLYWELRQWIMEGCDIPDDKELANELAVLKKEDKRGALWIVSKKKMSDDGIASPNKADSLMLAMKFRRLLTSGTDIIEKSIEKQERYSKKIYSSITNSWLTL